MKRVLTLVVRMFIYMLTMMAPSGIAGAENGGCFVTDIFNLFGMFRERWNSQWIL